MSIQNWSEGVILVDLPGGPELERELEKVSELLLDRADCAVLLDLSNVSILNSHCLAILLRIRRQLQICGSRLVLFNIGTRAGGILSVTGLVDVFEIAGDRSQALAAVQANGGNCCARQGGSTRNNSRSRGMDGSCGATQ
jgi:anti-anti-sigma factor